MLSTRIRGQIMQTRNKPQKIDMRVATPQYETSGENNAHLLSHNVPAGEKNSLEQTVVWHEVKVVCCFLTPLLHTAYAR